MQTLPEEAFAPPLDAVRALKRGDRSIVALSHPWRSALFPDPLGTTCAAVLKYLEALQVAHPEDELPLLFL